jgi:hypothetical protein
MSTAAEAAAIRNETELMIRQLGLKPGSEMPRGPDEDGPKDAKGQGGKQKGQGKDAARKQGGAKDAGKPATPQSGGAAALGGKSGGAMVKKGDFKKPQHTNQKMEMSRANVTNKNNNIGATGSLKNKVCLFSAFDLAHIHDVSRY